MTASEKSRWRKLANIRSAPNFQLQSATSGKTLSLDSFNYKRLVVSFLPGVWAPWCRKFLDELDATSRNHAADDLKFVVIISQDFHQVWEYVHSENLRIEVICDPNGVIGKRYGVFDDNILEPMRISKPSVFILDSQKNLAFTFIGKFLMDRPQMGEIIAKAQEPLGTDPKQRSRFNFGFKKLAYAGN